MIEPMKTMKISVQQEKNEFTAVEFNIYEKFLDIFPFIYLLTFLSHENLYFMKKRKPVLAIVNA